MQQKILNCKTLQGNIADPWCKVSHHSNVYGGNAIELPRTAVDCYTDEVVKSEDISRPKTLN